MSGPQRARSAVPLVVLVAAVGILLVLLGAHVQPSGYAPRPLTYSFRYTTPAAPAAHSGRPAPPAHQSRSLPGPAFVLPLYTVLAFGAVALLVALAVRALAVRARPRHTKRPAGYDPAQLAEQLASAVSAGLDELAEDVPSRDAIIACWQRLRLAATDAGIRPAASDTPDDAVTRVLTAGRARAEPLRTLAALYREARFSRHAMTDAHVDAARAALREILADLSGAAAGAR